MIRPILITGVPRSGIELTASLLCAATNARRLDFGTTLETILSKFGYDGRGLAPLPLLDYVREQCEGEGQDAAMQYIRGVIAEIAAKTGASGDVIIADARLAVLWPLFRKMYPEARWVLTARHPADMLRSMTDAWGASASREPKFWRDVIDSYGQRLIPLQANIPIPYYFEAHPDNLTKGDWFHFLDTARALGFKVDLDRAKAFYKRDKWKGLGDGRVPLHVATNINVDNAAMLANIRSAMTRKALPLVPQPQHGARMAIVGGGPSLKDTFADLKKLRKRGDLYIMALNGTHNWLLERGVVPDACVVMDARPENAAFVARPRKGVVYFIASQCAPAVWDAVARARVVRWHAHQGAGEDAVLRECGSREPPIIAGCTVASRANVIAMLLGFSKFHLFGLDSCYAADGSHHAYPQAINDGEKTLTVFADGRQFLCSAWQARQAEDFQDLWKAFPHLVTTVHGDGLIAAMAQERIKDLAKEKTNGQCAA